VKKLNRNGAAERRAEYARLRLAGVSSIEAAAQVGVQDPSTRSLYERWALAGHPEIPASPPSRRPYHSFNEAGSAS
jgi:hypothetical protein